MNWKLTSLHAYTCISTIHGWKFGIVRHCRLVRCRWTCYYMISILILQIGAQATFIHQNKLPLFTSLFSTCCQESSTLDCIFLCLMLAVVHWHVVHVCVQLLGGSESAIRLESERPPASGQIMHPSSSHFAFSSVKSIRKEELCKHRCDDPTSGAMMRYIMHFCYSSELLQAQQELLFL